MTKNSNKEKEILVYTPLDSMRTNRLSTTPGGSTVTFVYEEYEVNQTKVKDPEAYIRASLRNTYNIEDIKDILVNFKSVNWKSLIEKSKKKNEPKQR